MVVQLIYMDSGSYLVIKGIKPNQEDLSTGEITLAFSPSYIEKKERYYIENKLLKTDSFFIPITYIYQFLADNGCTQVKEDGKEYIVLKEVEFKVNKQI